MHIEPAKRETVADDVDVIDLSSPDLWADGRFHGMILKGLEKDGFGPNVIVLVSQALNDIHEDTG